MKKIISAGLVATTALSSVVLSSVALAQDGAGAKPIKIDEPIDVIVVTATGLSTATSTTKTSTPIIESPQSISVISRSEIDLRAASTIADALSYSAGVQAEPSGIDSRTDEVSVRGFGAGGFSSNNNFVDGLRLPAGGQWTRFGFDPFGLEQIEVLKGPSSVLYGQSAPGGMVNLVTKRATAERQGEIVLQGQSYTGLKNWSGRAEGDISGALTEDGSLTGRLVGLVHDGGTQVNDVDNSRYYISPTITWQPNDAISWTVLGQYQRDEGGSTYQFLPSTGTYQPSNGQYIENDANIGEPDWNTFDRSQYLLGSFFEYEFSPNLKLRNNLRYTHINTLFRLTVLSGDTITDCATAGRGPDCIDGQTVGRRAVQGKGESDGFAVDTQLEGSFETGSASHTVLAGIDYFHTEWEHFRDLVSMPGQPAGQVEPLWDIFNPQPRGSDDYEANMNPQIYSSSVSKQMGVYLQDQIAIGDLRVTLGGRYDWADDDSEDLLSSTLFATDANDFTWRAGAVYLFDNGFAPYFGYSQSFLPQVVDPSQTLGGILFEPTTGTQYEAGVRYQQGQNIYLTLGVFQITQQNVPTSDPNGTLCGRRVCQVQAGEARVRGIELEGRASLTTGTTIIASASHMDAEVTESNDPIVGNKLQAVPKYLASLFVDHRIDTGAMAGFGFGGGLRYTGKSFGDTNNLFPINDYTLFDLFVRYNLGEVNPDMEGLTLSLNTRNITDKRYVVTCGTSQSCYYGQGRVMTARLQYKW